MVLVTMALQCLLHIGYTYVLFVCLFVFCFVSLASFVVFVFVCFAASFTSLDVCVCVFVFAASFTSQPLLEKAHGLACEHHLLEGRAYNLLAKSFQEEGPLLVEVLSDDITKQLKTIVKATPTASLTPQEVRRGGLLVPSNCHNTEGQGVFCTAKYSEFPSNATFVYSGQVPTYCV